MRARRLIACVTVSAAASVTMALAAPAQARPAVSRADRCLTRAPIPVVALAATARSGCSLVGRLVTDGRIGVVVPPAGLGVSGDGLRRAGDDLGLTVVNTGRTVRAVSSVPADRGGGWWMGPLVTPRTPEPSRSTTACSDRTFNLEHHRWYSPLGYRINLRRMPARFAASTVIAQVQAANANMRTGRNTCGKPRLKTPAAHYLGRTTTRPSIDPAGPTCAMPGNPANVVGFGNLPGSLLGWTCYWYDARGHMVGADVLLDNGPGLVTRLPASCANKWDFEGTVTHEFGHVYGLAHTGDGHPQLTMQHALTPCSTYARTLGLGDWLGMNRMYGHR